MEEFAPLFVGVAVLVGGFVVVWFTTQVLNRLGTTWPLWAKALVAGTMPTLLIIAVLTAWHVQVLPDVRAGKQEGFMSPLVILIYGFPIFLMNLVLNYVVSVSLLKRK